METKPIPLPVSHVMNRQSWLSGYEYTLYFHPPGEDGEFIEWVIDVPPGVLSRKPKEGEIMMVMPPAVIGFQGESSTTDQP